MRVFQALIFGLLQIFLSCVAQKRFIFRLDDIEDYYNSNIQIEMLNFFMDRGVAVSAGIIGDYFTGEDVPLYTALQRCASLGPDLCALFNHGADATFTYASATSTAEAYNRMKTCDDKIHTLFNNYKVELFVPHQNSWNQYTLAAAKQLGYPAVSASTESYSNLIWNTASDPLQLSQHTTTALYTSSGAWAAYPIESTVADCEAVNALGQTCVIMTHPHEFSQGAYTIEMLGELIDALNEAGFTKSINFHTLINEMKGTTSTTAAPTKSPTLSPTATVTRSPTISPTVSKTNLPTITPTITKTTSPSFLPTAASTNPPTIGVTASPTIQSSASPTSAVPIVNPTAIPTSTVTTPAALPTTSPTTLVPVTANPTLQPTNAPTVKKTKRFSFRLDNIVDTKNSATQVNLLSYFLDHSISVTAGIIGNSVTGQDVNLLNALKRCVSIGSDKCSLAVQGGNATYSFGTATSVAQAKAEIQATEKAIQKLFPGYSPKVFIPTENTWNAVTLAAVRGLGYAAMSGSSSSTTSKLTWDLTTKPIQLPQQTSTGIIGTTGSWESNSVSQIVSDCDNAASNDEVCIIRVTVNEFVSGAFSTEMLQSLITALSTAGFSNSVNFHTIISEIQASSPSLTPTQSPVDTASNSKSKSSSWSYNPPNYMIAVIVVVGFVIIAWGIYLILYYRAKQQQQQTIDFEKKARESNSTLASSRGSIDLGAVSTDNLIEFSAENDEEKSLPLVINRNSVDRHSINRHSMNRNSVGSHHQMAYSSDAVLIPSPVASESIELSEV